jgi:hypothetical protein
MAFDLSQRQTVGLAWHVYDPLVRPCPESWKLIEPTLVEAKDGLKAAAYVSSLDPDHFAVAICGSLTPADFDDCDLVYRGTKEPRQYHSLLRYLQMLEEKFNIRRPILIGHSLGGYTAKMVGVTHNLFAIGVNSPGVLSSLEHLGWNDRLVRASHRGNNIYQYVVSNDVIGCFGRHIGVVRLLPSQPLETPLGPHRAWDALRESNHVRGQPDFEGALDELISKQPLALPLYALLQQGTLKLSDLFALQAASELDAVGEILGTVTKRNLTVFKNSYPGRFIHYLQILLSEQ